MELRHLRYFVAVAEERNFTRAAERLHIAQPPLSRQIQQLEEILDVSLFVRGSRPLELTEAGRFFYGHAQQLLALSAEIVSMTRRIGKITQKFTMGFVGSTLFGLLPEVVRRFRAAHPDTEFNLLEMTTMEQIQALKDGVIDVGIGRIRHEDKSIRRIILREEPLIAALPMGHALGFLDRGLFLRELVNDTLIVFPKAPRPSYADSVLAAFHDRGLEPAKVYEARELQVGAGPGGRRRGRVGAAEKRAWPEAQRRGLQDARRRQPDLAGHHEHPRAGPFRSDPVAAAADLRPVPLGRHSAHAGVAVTGFRHTVQV